MTDIDASPGWRVDPTGRHQLRFWSGVRWTDHVCDDTVVGTDSINGSGPAVTAIASPERQSAEIVLASARERFVVPTKPEPTYVRATPPPGRRRRWVSVAVVILVVALAAVGIAQFGPFGSNRDGDYLAALEEAGVRG